MSRFISLALFVLVLALVHAESSRESNRGANKEFYCKYYQRASFQSGDAKLSLGDLDTKLCDRVIVNDRTIVLNEDTLELTFSDSAYKNDLLKNARALKQKNRHVRIYLQPFLFYDNELVSQILAKQMTFAKFAENLAQFVAKARVFDGFIMRTRFNLNVDESVTAEFYKALKDAFHAKRLMLLGDMRPFDDSQRASFPYLDRIIVNDRDINALNVDTLTHITALGRRKDAQGLEALLNKNFELDYFDYLGAPRDKTIYLMNVLGLRFELVDARLTTIGAPRMPKNTYSTTPMSMPEVCGNLKKPSWSYTFDQELAAPYIYNATNWVSYDNLESFGYKMEMFRKKGLRGVVVDSIDFDDITGKYCDNGKFPYAQFIKKNL